MKCKGKLIIIEGSDGSGKATQTAKLRVRLAAEGWPVRQVEYPNYASPSSALIKMYLQGEFGSEPEAVNPYAASAFYAVDRYASFKKDWEEFYLQGGIVLADRYTTSNMIHQAAKIAVSEAKEKFLTWLWDFEFDKCGLPVPDGVIFLDMPPKYSWQLLAERQAVNSVTTPDIHEQNELYLAESYRNAVSAAEKYNWCQVHCLAGGCLRSIEVIHEEVYRWANEIIMPAQGLDKI